MMGGSGGELVGAVMKVLEYAALLAGETKPKDLEVGLTKEAQHHG
jgi:hypothetical protein